MNCRLNPNLHERWAIILAGRRFAVDAVVPQDNPVLGVEAVLPRFRSTTLLAQTRLFETLARTSARPAWLKRGVTAAGRERQRDFRRTAVPGYALGERRS
jgi:hypothetical protein